MSVVAMIVLLALFIARVAGQIVVVLRAPRWLPPMKDWYSGLLPYRWLLPTQIAIIALMIVMIGQVMRGERNHALAIGVIVFASSYAAAMLVRLVMLRRGMIPIFFHWVLAAFLFTYAQARL